MKKTISFLLIFVFAISLVSCITSKKNVKLSQKKDNVHAIEIYNSDHAYYEGDIHVFRDENKPIFTIESEMIAIFLDELVTLEFKEEKVFLPIPMDGGYNYEGYIITVVYLDGGYDIIAKEGLYSYAVSKDGNEKHKYDYSNYCGEINWNDFVEKYIEE